MDLSIKKQSTSSFSKKHLAQSYNIEDLSFSTKFVIIFNPIENNWKELVLLNKSPVVCAYGRCKETEKILINLQNQFEFYLVFMNYESLSLNYNSDSSMIGGMQTSSNSFYMLMQSGKIWGTVNHYDPDKVTKFLNFLSKIQPSSPAN